MSRRMFRNGIRGVLVAGVIISLLLLAPAVFNWAGRGGHQFERQSSAAPMDDGGNQRGFRGHPRLPAQPRPHGVEPFGPDSNAVTPAEARTLVPIPISTV